MADETRRVNVQYILDSTKMNAGLQEVNRDLRLNQSELKNAQAGLKAFGSSTENFAKVQKALGDTITSQSQKMGIYQESISKTQAKMEENIATRNELKASLEQEKAKLEASIQAYGQESEVTQNCRNKVAELTESLNAKNKAIESNEKSLNTYNTKLNQTEASLKRTQGELASVNKQLAENDSMWLASSKKLEESGKTLTSVGTGINNVSNKLIGMSAPILAADAVGSKLFMDFDDGMGKIATIADTTNSNLNKMGNQVIDLSNKTGQSTATLQDALYETISSGVQTGDAVNFLSNATKTAVGGFTDANTAVDGLTTVLNAYGMKASEATKISNQMIVAQNLGKTTFGEMAKSIGQVADTTANCNVKTQDLFSSLAVETAHGIDTSEAISGLRESLSNIIKPSDEATNCAKSLGLEFNAAHLKSVGWAKFLEEIKDKTHGNTTEMGQLFGSVQGLNTMITLTSESGMQLFNQSLQQMNSNTDYVDDAFNKVTNTSGNQFKISLNELKNSMIKLGEASEPIIDDLTQDIKWLTNTINGMNKGTLQNIETIALWTAGIGVAGKVVGGTIGTIGKVEGVLSKVAKAMGTTSVATEAVGTASATAGEAVVGVATATEGATIATTAGVGGLGAMASGLGALVVAAAPWVLGAAAVGAAGYGIYKAYKYATDNTIHQTDLFADDIETKSKRIVNADGTVTNEIEQNTVKISKATKDKVGAYMDLDKKVSKSMMDIYVNANNFSKQEKSTVIDQYTQMVNKVTSLTGSNKTATINDFKQLVSNTTDLTKQNRSQIVAEYSKMVNQVSGLTAQQKQKVIKDFSDSLTQASGVTKTQAANIINQFKQMGDKINQAIDKSDNDQIKKVQDLFSKTTTISNQEQTDILSNMKKSDSSKKSEAEIYEKQISDIYTKASDEHRNLTQQEEDTVNDIRQRMQKLAVQSMSQSEVEQKVIMTRLKDYNGKMTDQQASDTIANAEKQRKGAVDAANKQYDDTLATIIKMRDQDHSISSQQADDMIKEAKRQRDGAVNQADSMKTDVVKKVTDMDSNVKSDMDTQTGKMLSPWQKLQKGIDDVIGNIEKRWAGMSLPEKVGHIATTASDFISGNFAKGIADISGYETGTDSATAGLHLVGEEGMELINFSGGEQVLNHEETMKLINGNIGDNKASIKYGENLVAGIAEGMKNKINLLSSATSNASTVINAGMNKAYTDINTIFKDQLGDSVDVLDNYAIKVSSTLSNMVYKWSSQRSGIFDNIAKGTSTADIELQKLAHTNDMLAASTGNSETDLKNMLGQMTNLSTMAVVADNAYLKLGNTVGWTDSKTQEMLKNYQDYQKQYNELGQKVIEEQQKISDSVSSSLNDLFSKLKDSLKDKYTEMQKQDEDYWNEQIDNNNKWKENTLKNLETVYNANKDKLDKEKTDLDRSFDDQDDADKEAELRKELSMHLGAEKQKEVQQELNDLIKQRDRRHQKEQLDDQESALDKQYKVDQNNVNAIAEANEDNYKAQIKIVDDFYAEKLKDANIDAEAQKMIIENNQSDIIKLLKDYGKDYELAGASLGDRFVSSFKDRLSSIQGVINSIIGQVNTIDINSINSTTNLSSSTASTPATRGNNIMDSLNNMVSKINGTTSNNSENTNTTTTINVPVSIDGKQVAKATSSYMNREQGMKLALEMRGL